MNSTESKAWEMLTEQEKNSLMLTLANGMSSWEAGEILGIAHYKYLEIKERAEKFFKLFVEYFEANQTTSIFSPNTHADSRFVDYIEGCLEKRLSRKDAITYSGDSSLVVGSIRNKHIINNLNRLKDNKLVPQDQLTYKLIMEFDRWNNWRILPRKIQMPSAYKRRNNKREKVYLKYITSLPTKTINALMDILWYNPNKSFKKRRYIALISEELFEDDYLIISVKDNDETIEMLNKLYIYAFEKKEHADIFGHLATKYKEKTTKATAGQKYWPLYRETIGRAINYNQVNNINFYVDHLDEAYTIISSHKPKRQLRYGAKRASTEIFEK